ncbi:Histidine kinase-, DNA gyrase B-, and HSP90-like ATPase [Duganella sacchari]|uniref:Histidine kinase-, DNA gyrase B-, and HSP90-like ATPase n=1 Tax=Duganella sacchari TaxID=551987 RepID=A0A1M7LDS9_9BURK|nr:sensor histidine kinase [Duganella sacchari]SHM75569.1 Histidine kinase-, DNA gyrase B-, and HSP90-like ATPase [Duganella sacchari]
MTSRLSAVPRLLAGFFLLTLACAAQALNPATALPDYHHTAWTSKDGAPAEIASMAQTSDGRLWMASPFGLYYFDGVRFTQYKLPHGANFPVFMVRAHPNGDLWFSYAGAGGLSVLHPDGKLEEVVPIDKIPPSSQMAFDDNGDVWTGSARGLFRIRQGQVRRYGAEQGLPNAIADIRVDRYNRFWAAGFNAVYLYDRTTDRFQQVRALPVRSGLIESPDGRIWTTNSEKIEALPAPADPSARMAPQAKPGSLPGFGTDWVAHFDRDGNLWQLKCPNDLCVTPAHVVAKTDAIAAAPKAADGLKMAPGATALAGNAILEDREHNIWVATMEGLDRYRDNRMQRFRLSSSRAVYMTTVDENGQFWAADPYNNAVWKLKVGAEPERDPTPASVTAKSRDGGLLLPWKRDIEHRYHGKIDKIAMPEVPDKDGRPQDLMVLGLTDDGKRLWLMTVQAGLFLKDGDGPWLPRSKYKLPPKIVMGTPGAKPGHTWLACADGTVVLFDENDRQTIYPAPMAGLATGIFTDGGIVVGGDKGLAVLVGDRFRQLTAADPEVLQNISGLVVTPDGDRWLNGGKGLVHIRGEDWKAALLHPEQPMRYRLFGADDGYVGKAMLENRHPSAKLDKDGQLWLNSTGGLLRFDTRNISRNDVAPVVSVQGLHTAAASYAVQPDLKLPAGAHSFNINYSAASLRQPEGVHFQYRMEGADRDWQDAGPRRTAYYTNVPPGAYRFQVRAANEDDVWSAQPASVDFEIEPTVVQTWWFRAVCVLAIGIALYLLYLYRLRVVTARLEERMEVRLAERERIARALHDTFLQSVQGLVLRLDAAVDGLPGDSATRKSLAPILDSARASITEGRAQVHELRASQLDELESGLRDIAALLSASYPGSAFELAVSGKRTMLRAGVVEDICEIAREAVRNAFQHAEAERIVVQLDYGAQHFTFSVRDDGKGMPPTPASGHWGLVGMRERAARIGAALKIDSTQDAGSSVTMTLSAPRAYAGHRKSWWRRLFG